MNQLPFELVVEIGSALTRQATSPDERNFLERLFGEEAPKEGDRLIAGMEHVRRLVAEREGWILPSVRFVGSAQLPPYGVQILSPWGPSLHAAADLGQLFNEIVNGSRAALHTLTRKPIFVSYRRDDSWAVAARLGEILANRYGPHRIFLDVQSIPLGADYRQVLLSGISSCGICLALIGPMWEGPLGPPPAPRRLDYPNDFVRMELEIALSRNIPVIPLMINGRSMPQPYTLPPSLQPIFYRQGVVIRPDPAFWQDVESLAVQLDAM